MIAGGLLAILGTLVIPAAIYTIVYRKRYIKDNDSKQFSFLALAMFSVPVVIVAAILFMSVRGRLQYNLHGGPGAQYVQALGQMSSLEDVKKQIDACNVSALSYYTIDPNGPPEPKNTYIEANMRYDENNPDAAIPEPLRLPFSDNQKIIDLVQQKNANPSGSSAACSEKIEIENPGRK